LPLLNVVTVNRGDYIPLEVTTLVVGGLLAACAWKIGQPAVERALRVRAEVG
jgi:hypothetical protein